MSNTIDDASLWWESRHQQVQNFETPPPPPSFVNIEPELSTSNQEPEYEKVTASDVKQQLNMIKLNEPTAQIIVSIADAILPLLLCIVLKNVQESKIKLTPSENETLVQAWANYLQTTNINLSPGVVLITTMLTIYGAKITLIMMDRKKEKSEIDAIKEQNNLLKQLTAELKTSKNEQPAQK